MARAMPNQLASLIRIAFFRMLDGYGIGINPAMATRFKSVIAFLAAVAVVTTAACAGDPESDIDATIEAGIAATMVGVAIEKGVRATIVASIDYKERGATYSKLGEYGKAIQDYAKAIQLDPNNALGYYNRGYAYFQLMEPEDLPWPRLKSTQKS